MTDPNNSDLDPSVSGTNLTDTLTQQIWEEFFPKLARYAKQKMGTLPRRAVDEEDIALSAINSFFTGVKNGKFTIDERGDLWRILATIAARKVIRQNRRFFAAKRGNGKVRGESVFEDQETHVKNTGLDQFIDRHKMPALQEHIIASCEEMLDMLKNEQLRTTALMRMNGYSNQEISDALNCSVARTKQRISKIKQVWADLDVS